MVQTGYGYYLDGYLKSNLDEAIRVVKNNWDMMFAIDGYEGSGKSTLALQMAYYCDPTLTIDRVCFNGTEFKNAIMKAEKNQSVVFDEAFTGLSSREAMSKMNKSLVQMLAEIRQKNLFVFVVMPSFFDLDKYVALHRTRALIHVYSGEKFMRGFFEFYDIEKKKDLYIMGKKFYTYKYVNPNFRGRFPSFCPIDEEAYKKKKYDSLNKKDVVDVQLESRQEFKLFQRRLFEHLKKYEGIKVKDKIMLLEVSNRTFYNWLENGVNSKEEDDFQPNSPSVFANEK